MSLTRIINTMILICLSTFLVSIACKEKTIIYKPMTESVELASPPNGDLVFVEFPALNWHALNDIVNYQVQVATDATFLEKVIDSTLIDTSIVYTESMPNNRYYWRVRAQNLEHLWGDWSDANIWSFRVNDKSEYIELAAIVPTPGIAQDVFVCDGTAYVADGQMLLTVIDVANPEQPAMIGNLDRQGDDFARSVWKLRGDNIAFVADTDGKIFALDVSLPLDPNSIRSRNIGRYQNLYDVYGMTYQDSLYIFAITNGYGHRGLELYRILMLNDIPSPDSTFVISPPQFSTDPYGVFFSSMDITIKYDKHDSVYYENQTGMFVFIAASEAGLGWYNVSAIHTYEHYDTLLLRDPRELGWSDTPSLAQKVFVRDGFAYVADDRGGLEIFDLPDTIPSFDNDPLSRANPVLISDINTSGRTKDVHVVGNYCFLADGGSGLKVIDVTDPYAPFFVAAYDTQYAYGVWADDDYIYLADRDYGLMIFRNKL